MQPRRTSLGPAFLDLHRRRGATREWAQERHQLPFVKADRMSHTRQICTQDVSFDSHLMPHEVGSSITPPPHIQTQKHLLHREEAEVQRVRDLAKIWQPGRGENQGSKPKVLWPASLPPSAQFYTAFHGKKNSGPATEHSINPNLEQVHWPLIQGLIALIWKIVTAMVITLFPPFQGCCGITCCQHHLSIHPRIHISIHPHTQYLLSMCPVLGMCRVLGRMMKAH